MSVKVKCEQIYVGTKRPWVKTIVIQSVENDRRNDQWDYDSSCRNTIRTTKKGYNSATRSLLWLLLLLLLLRTSEVLAPGWYQNHLCLISTAEWSTHDYVFMRGHLFGA